MKRKMIHYMARFLHECGIEIIEQDTRIAGKPASYRKTWRIITLGTFFTMLMISSIGYFIVNRNDFYEAISPVPFFAGAFTSVSAVATVFQFRKKLSNILYQMDDNLYMYPDEHLIHVEYQWYLRENNVVFMINVLLGLHYVWLIAITIPGLGELFFNGKIETYPYPGWTPWKTDDINSQLFAFLLQCWILLCACLVNTINLLTLCVIFFEFVRQYKRLNAAVESLKRRTLAIMASAKMGDECYNKILRENIVHCIRHYQIQHENLQVFGTWFSKYFSYELAVYVLSFSFALFVTMNAPNLEKVINQFTIIAYTNISILIKCIIGDVLVELNEDFANTLFSQTEWYDVDKDNRRVIQTFHMVVQSRRSNLMGFSIFKANRVTFAEIIRTAYSPGFPFMLRIRELFGFLATLLEGYIICWVGTTLEQMTADLSFAMYSTPWYLSVGNRKDVYILLCQTQAPILPVALNVYPLTLALYLRFCSVINSVVNVARANTRLK